MKMARGDEHRSALSAAFISEDSLALERLLCSAASTSLANMTSFVNDANSARLTFQSGDGTRRCLTLNEMFSPNVNGVSANGGQPWISSHAVDVTAKRECLT